MRKLQRVWRLAVAAITASVALVAVPVSASAHAVVPCSTYPLTGKPGFYVCDYGYTKYMWADGHSQYFITGTNDPHEVYTAYEVYCNGCGYWTDWIPLGGDARSKPIVTNVLTNGTQTVKLTIRVLGNNLVTYWCRDWSDVRGWGSWYTC